MQDGQDGQHGLDGQGDLDEDEDAVDDVIPLGCSIWRYWQDHKDRLRSASTRCQLGDSVRQSTSEGFDLHSVATTTTISFVSA